MKNELSPGINRRTLLLMGAASLPLAGCNVSGLIGPPPASQIYLLHPAALPALDGPKVAWGLSIAEPRAPGILDTDRIAIRRSADTEDYYANAVWQDSLPDIVEGVLVSGFEESGRIDQIARDTEGVRTDYVLKVDIRNFEARYDQPNGAPTAVVTFEANLIDGASRRLVAHRTAHVEETASANTIPAAVEALNRALGGAVADVVKWTLAAVPSEQSSTSGTSGTAAKPTRSHRRRHAKSK